MEVNATSSIGLLHDGSWSLAVRSIVGSLFGIIIFVGVIGNTIIITSIARERRFHTRGHYLIGSLATADLLVALLVSPFFAFMTLQEFSSKSGLSTWTPHRPVCQLFVFLDVTCCTASIFHLCVIAHDRYRAVTKLRYLHKRKFLKVLPSICGIWLCAILLSLAPHVIFSASNNNTKFLNVTQRTSFEQNEWKERSLRNATVYEYSGNFTADLTSYEDPSLSCLAVNDNKAYRVVATTIAFYLPLVIIIVIYSRVSVIAWGRIHGNVTPGHESAVMERSPDKVSPTNEFSKKFHEAIQIRRRLSFFKEPSINPSTEHHASFFSLIRRKYRNWCCFTSHPIENNVTMKKSTKLTPTDNRANDIDLIRCANRLEKQSAKNVSSSLNPSENCLRELQNSNFLNKKLFLDTGVEKQKINDYSAVTSRCIDRPLLSTSLPCNIDSRLSVDLNADAAWDGTTVLCNTSCDNRSLNSTIPGEASTLCKRTLSPYPRSRKHAVSEECLDVTCETSPTARTVQVPSIMFTPAQDEAFLLMPLNCNRNSLLSNNVKKQDPPLKRSQSVCTNNAMMISRGMLRTTSVNIRRNKFSFSLESSRCRSMSSASFVRTRLTMNREKKVIRTMGAVIGAFIICWLPFFIKELVVPFCDSCSLNPVAEVIINWLGYTNSSLNPFIYAFANDEFNKAIRKLFRDTFWWCKIKSRK